jgi:ATP-binding cassette, subfamily B, multidrug efflux pump
MPNMMPRNNAMNASAKGEKTELGPAIKKLAHYCRSYLPFIAIAIVLAVAGAVLSLIGPNKILSITDEINAGMATGGIDLASINQTAIFLVYIYSFSVLFSYLQSMIMTLVTNSVSKKLRSDIDKKINAVPLKYIDSSSTGDILSRLTNDVDLISQALTNSVASLISSIVLAVGCAIMMFYTNWIMALTAVVSSLIGFGLMMLIMGKSQRFFVKQQDGLGKLNGHVEEIFSNHSTVISSNALGKNEIVFDKLNDSLYFNNWMAQFLSGLMQPLMGFVGNLGYVAICVAGALLVHNGTITFGVITAFIIYIRLFSQPLTSIAQGMTYLQQASAASKRVFEFLEEPEVSDESAKTTKLEKVRGAVDFQNVHFGYDKGKEIIHGFSVEALPGQKIAIVGPTGAGKTTMVNLLMRFYEVDSGDIKIDGVSTKLLRRENVHALFGMVLQDTWLFQGTVRENLKFGSAEVSDEVMEKAAEACDIGHFIHTLPKGYDTVIDDTLEISSGQKQLLTIARAMIQNAPMLILDEATSSVDTRTELVIQKAMDSLTVGRTSFIIAHRLSTIKNANLIIVMKEGEIVESGTHQELLARSGFYAELYNSQFADSEA